MPANHILLQRTTLTADATTVTLNSIPQTGYTDLKLVMSVRTTHAGSVGDYLSVSFNGTTTGYTGRLLIGNGSTVSSITTNNQRWFAQVGSNGQTANSFGNAEVYIPNYTGSNQKSFSSDSVAETNAAASEQELFTGLWSGTGAITSIALTSGNTANIMAGSSFSLYGIANTTAIPKISPKADGGDIIKTDGTYWYHAFTSTGLFKPQLNLTCDVLVVAGGGGGGYSYGAGGGGGGLLYFSSQALTTSPQVVTVGAGGAGVTGGPGFNGGNSQFGSLTTAIGGGGGGSSVAPGTGGNGGSGGGGGAAAGTGYAGGTATSGQGFNGRSGVAGAAGGGGGAGALAAAISGKIGGAGGAGSSAYSSWGAATGTGKNVSSTYYYAGGGSGNGEGGAAAAAAGGNNQGIAGAMSTGSGAGGDAQNSSGGSGIVIIRYPV